MDATVTWMRHAEPPSVVCMAQLHSRNTFPNAAVQHALPIRASWIVASAPRCVAATVARAPQAAGVPLPNQGAGGQIKDSRKNHKCT